MLAHSRGERADGASTADSDMLSTGSVAKLDAVFTAALQAAADNEGDNVDDKIKKLQGEAQTLITKLGGRFPRTVNADCVDNAFAPVYLVAKLATIGGRYWGVLTVFNH